MNTTKRNLYLGVLKALNLGILVVALAIASVLNVYGREEGISVVSFFSIRVRLINILVFGLILLIWHGIFSICGQYRSQRLLRRRSMFAGAIKAVTLCSLFLGMLAVALQIQMITPAVLLLFWLLASLLVSGMRLITQVCLEILRKHDRNLRYILILGTNRRAMAFARRLHAKPELGYRVLGFVDQGWHHADGLEAGYPLCCTFSGLSEYLRRNVVDEVASFLPLRSFHEQCSRIADLCEQHGIFMRFDSEIFDLKIARPETDELDGNLHIIAHSSLRDSWPTLVKRLVDVSVSFGLLLILAPVLAFIAVIVKLSSKGPVFFRQERVGLNKRRLFMYKFRTMVQNAESLLPQLEALNEATGPVFKIRNDPRITPVGRLLRRTSLDELPQLLNVLRGDMSLVGPRPLPLRDYEGFTEDWQRRRFSVRPGITCLWQVNGRSNIGFDQWMELDLKYLDEWSIWLDMKILAQTIPAVMKGSGAA
jgi:exopolysaccharide biosynthesis polyprenyl glycosylphosphotransferase